MLTCAFLILVGCQGDAIDDVAEESLELSGTARRARSEAIRDSAGIKGMTNGVLLAGIAQVETGLSHCWSEATWACQGPSSSFCGGPVIAGAADGPCSAQQGGLGMFQFDGGTFEQTLARDGTAILELDGNIEHAVDFVAQRVIEEVSGVGSYDQAISWLNSINVVAGDPVFEEWIEIVSCRYNGCCGCSSQEAKYRNATLEARDEFEPGFWGDVTEPPQCEQVPAIGAVIDETDPCADAGGDPRWWRSVGDAGFDGGLMWTHTTDSAETENFARWNLTFAAAGDYRIDVHTDGGTYGQSGQAAYRIAHEGGEETVLIDQAAVDGWQTLGTFSFAAGVAYRVRVDDNTGEPLADETRLQFDALRVAADDGTDPTDPSNPNDPPADDPNNPDDGDDGDDLAGGCQASPYGGAGTLLPLFCAGLLLLRRRRD